MLCIYCMEDKEPQAFRGREHVIPQSFGGFEPDNMILHCVCDPCNNEMGKTIDRKLANDTIEGIDRIRYGVKDATEYQSIRRRSTLRVEFTDGEMKGRSGYPVASRDDPRAPGVEVFPHVVITVDGRDPVIFKPEDLPSPNGLKGLGVEKGIGYLIQSHEIEDFDKLLRAKGYDLDKMERGQSPSLSGRVPLEYVAKYHEPDYRAITKIALNYVAYQHGAKIAQSPAFDIARQYARYGSSRARLTVRAFINRFYEGRNAHYISVRRAANLILVQISLHTRTRFVVGLTNRGDEVPFRDTAHWFDVDRRRFNSMPTLPNVGGEELQRPSPKGTEVP